MLPQRLCTWLLACAGSAEVVGAAAVAAMGVLGLMCRLRMPMCRLTSPAMCRPALERRALPGCCGGGEGCAELRARSEARCRDEGGLAPSDRGTERVTRRSFHIISTASMQCT